MTFALFLILAQASRPLPPLRIPSAALPQTMEFAVSRVTDSGVGARVATWHLEYRAVEIRGAKAVEYVSRFSGLNGKTLTVDSVTLMVDGMVPVSERSHQSTKIMNLRFDRDSTIADVTDTGGSHHVVTPTPPPYFNSTDTPLAVLSLPAERGIRGVIREYQYEAGGLVDDTLSVEDIAPGRMTARSATAEGIWTWEIDTRAHTILHASRRGRAGGAGIDFSRTDRR